MKKRTFVIILSIIEIITIILFIATFKITLEKSMEILLNNLMSGWISTKEVIITPREKIIMSINNISTSIFLISIILRTIFTNKKSRIAILIIPLFFGILYLIYDKFGNQLSKTSAGIIGIIFAIIMIIAYIYSHIAYFKEIIKIKK